MRNNYIEENFDYSPIWKSHPTPIINREIYIPVEIFKNSSSLTETEQRINRGYKIDKIACMKEFQKIRNCYNELRDFFKIERMKIENEDIIKLIKDYINNIPDWEKKKKIIRSDYNISAAIFYRYLKDYGKQITKKQFLKKYKIEEKHLNKVLQAKSVIANKFRRKNLGYDKRANIQFSNFDNDTFDVGFVPAIDLDENNNLIYERNQIKQDKKISFSGNPLYGFMICILFLKFIRECEEAHYEYLLKNRSFYKRGAFFIDSDISYVKIPIDLLRNFKQNGESEKLQKLMKQLISNLIEDIFKDLYEYDEDIDVYKKSREKIYQKLSINFIQLIKGSGFTPPVCV